MNREQALARAFLNILSDPRHDTAIEVVYQKSCHVGLGTDREYRNLCVQAWHDR